MTIDQIKNGAGELGKHLMFGGSAGAGALLIYLFWDLAKQEPKAFIEAIVRLGQSWGPTAIIAALIVVVGARFGGQLIEVNKVNGEQLLGVSKENSVAALKTAVAMQELADGVKRIAEKDDERQRENELLLGHLARNAQRTKELLEEAAEVRKGQIEAAAEQAKTLRSIDIRLGVMELGEQRANGQAAGS